jgi:hypothetical protein
VNWETGEEDGSGWGGLAPSYEERRQAREFNKIIRILAEPKPIFDHERWAELQYTR